MWMCVRAREGEFKMSTQIDFVCLLFCSKEVLWELLFIYFEGLMFLAPLS